MKAKLRLIIMLVLFITDVRLLASTPDDIWVDQVGKIKWLFAGNYPPSQVNGVCESFGKQWSLAIREKSISESIFRLMTKSPLAEKLSWYNKPPNRLKAVWMQDLDAAQKIRFGKMTADYICRKVYVVRECPPDKEDYEIIHSSDESWHAWGIGTAKPGEAVKSFEMFQTYYHKEDKSRDVLCMSYDLD